MTIDPGWYDSVWLKKYYAAKAVVSQVAPQKLTSFLESFDVLRTDPGFEVKDVPGVFDAAALASIKEIIRSIPMQAMEMHEMKRFGRFVVHDHPAFTQMQAALTADVARLAGEDVEPSYNFLSMYTRMGICEPHLDAPSAKWTLDVCIDQSEPWPIHFSQVVPWPEEPVYLGDEWETAIKSSSQFCFRAKELAPGNGILFSGSSQWHYRNAMPQSGRRGFCELLFFHYIPKGSSEIVKPANWSRIFAIPELAAIARLDEAA